MSVKKIFGYVFLFVFMFSLVSGAQAQGFTDNHNDNVLTGWTSTGSRPWSESNGKALPANANNNVGLLINDYACANDGTLEVAMTSDQWNGMFGGVIMRYTSTSSYLFITVRPADQWGSYIKVISNSTNPDAAGTVVASGFTTGTTFTLKVEASGSTFRCYLNNTLRGSFTNTNHPSGKVGYGYYSQWNRYTSYDNITWTDAAPANYTLAVTTVGSGTVSPSSGTYPAGTNVTLTATPAAGYRFAGWSGDLTGTTNPASVVMNSNKAITASFELIPVNYTLSTTVTPTGSGTVSPASGTYPAGTSVSLTATPATGYRFVGWSGDLTGTTNPAAVVMSSNRAVTANFELIPVNYTLTTTVTPAGSGTVSPASGTYPSGTSVTLTATPAAGYRFVRWTGDLTGTTNPSPLVMNSNKTVTATFELIPVNYTLTTTVTPAGSGTVSPASGTFPSGTSVTLTATPAAGYRFVSWSGDLTGSTNPAAVVMSSNKAVTATFELIPVSYTLTATVTPAGSGTVSPASGTYPSGTSVTLTATPAAGYRFVSWSGDLSGSTNPATLIMDGNKVVTATFDLLPVKPNIEKLSITAKLFDANGSPVGSQAPVNLDITVRLYNAASSGILMYTETFLALNSQSITVEDGYLVARLGEGTTSDNLITIVRNNPNLWAEIQVGADILQRVPLTGAAYILGNP